MRRAPDGPLRELPRSLLRWRYLALVVHSREGWKLPKSASAEKSARAAHPGFEKLLQDEFVMTAERRWSFSFSPRSSRAQAACDFWALRPDDGRFECTCVRQTEGEELATKTQSFLMPCQATAATVSRVMRGLPGCASTLCFLRTPSTAQWLVRYGRYSSQLPFGRPEPLQRPSHLRVRGGRGAPLERQGVLRPCRAQPVDVGVRAPESDRGCAISGHRGTFSRKHHPVAQPACRSRP